MHPTTHVKTTPFWGSLFMFTLIAFILHEMNMLMFGIILFSIMSVVLMIGVRCRITAGLNWTRALTAMFLCLMLTLLFTYLKIFHA